jgi:hypothetical protein
MKRRRKKLVRREEVLVFGGGASIVETVETAADKGVEWSGVSAGMIR